MRQDFRDMDDRAGIAGERQDKACDRSARGLALEPADPAKRRAPDRDRRASDGDRDRRGHRARPHGRRRTRRG
jgi:hypothetical protein